MTVPEVQAPSSCGTLLTQPTKQAAEAHPSPVSEQWGLTRSPVKSRQHLLLRVDRGTSGALPQPARLPSPRSQRQSAIGSGSGMLPASPERHWRKREVPHLAQDEAQRSASPVATESHSKAWRHLPDNRAGQRGPGTWSGIYK